MTGAQPKVTEAPSTAPSGPGTRRTRVALLAVDAFTAVTALAGGALLVTGAEDERFPVEALRRTPFSDYTVPGWLLGVLVGGSAAGATVTIVRKPRTGGAASMGAGAILLAWTLGGKLVLHLPARTSTDWLTNVAYVGAGTAMVTRGASLRRWAGR